MKPLIISFSGGRTSGYLCHLMLEEWGGSRPLHFVFANTGQEHDKTLEFVNKCDVYFQLNLVWLEAVVDPTKGVGTSFKRVAYDTASRYGQPFEEVCSKYGIPNKAFPHCTRELKQHPIRAYIRSIGLRHGEYEMAIGIRHDEQKRINPSVARQHCAIYPLNDLLVDKAEVNEFWENMPFNLELQEHQGNCTWCWKKSDKKHALIATDSPQIYEFPRKMEALYQGGDKRVFFRGRRSTDAYLEYVSQLTTISPPASIDEDGGCSESCEPFT